VYTPQEIEIDVPEPELSNADSLEQSSKS
jgi:hypothetical protein